MATDREEVQTKQKKGAGTFKSPSGQTVTIGENWVQDFGITDWNSLQRAIRNNVGGAQGINATINGTPYLLTNNPNNPGFRSEGQIGIGGGLTGVPTAGFAADHKNTTGAMGLAPGLTSAAALLGPILGGAALTGALGGGAAAGGAGNLAGGAVGGGTAAAAPAGTLGGAAGLGGADLWGQAVGGMQGADAGLLNSVGMGATPGVTPATAGGFTGAQLGAAGVNPASVGLGLGGMVPAGAGAAAAGGGLLSGLGNVLGGGNGNTTLGIPNNVLGGLATGIGGVMAADSMGDAYRDVSQQFMNLGAPYRNLLQQSYQPGFDLWSQPGYAGAFDQAADAAARAVSAKSGNPFGNPGAMGEIQQALMNTAYLPALSNYRGQLGQFGGMGLNTAGTGSLAGAQTQGGAWEALGAAGNQIFNPQPSLNDLFKNFGLGGNQNYSLNIGGMKLG